MVLDRVDLHAGLLQHLPGHRILERLTGFDESGDRGVAPGGPGRLAAKQRPLAIADQHDDGRIDARKNLVPATGIGADANVTALAGDGVRAAGAAESVAVPPENHGPGVTKQTGLLGRQQRSNQAQILEARALGQGRRFERLEFEREYAAFAETAEQYQLGSIAVSIWQLLDLKVRRPRSRTLRHEVARIPHRDHLAARVRQALRKPLGILTPVRGPIKIRARENISCLHPVILAGHPRRRPPERRGVPGCASPRPAPARAHCAPGPGRDPRSRRSRAAAPGAAGS